MSAVLTTWARSLVDALIQAGVEDFVLSPGSRSTPLVAAVEYDGRARIHTLVDERVAAFFALGQARASGRPSVLIATSGTAGAHYFPAVIEAAESRLPLIALTADRPPELQGCRSPQTIDQLHLFGRHVRAFFELGLPDGSEPALLGLRRKAAQALAAAVHPDPGPVHLNFCARKPLEPIEPIEPIAHAPPGPTRFGRPILMPDPDQIARIAARLQRAERGLIACGPALFDAITPETASALARATGFPMVTEATSQLRFAPVECIRLDAFEAMVLAGAPIESPQVVIELGAPLTSSAWHQRVQRGGAERIVLARSTWSDPSSSAVEMIFADPEQSARALIDRLPPTAPSEWSLVLDRRNLAAWTQVSRVLESAPFSEAHVARAAVDALSEGSALAIANSLPVRHLDLWCPARASSIRVFSQRGANGIDGLIAGAAGAASAFGGRVVLMIGDVAFLHDLGGLAAARHQDNLTILIIDNDGGRIFEQLPIARSGAPLDNFLTSPRLDVELACRAFGMRCAAARSVSELRALLERGDMNVIHAVVPPSGARAMTERLERINSTDEEA